MKKAKITFRMIQCLADCEGEYAVPRPRLVKKWGVPTVAGIEKRQLIETWIDGGLVLTDSGALVLGAACVVGDLDPEVARLLRGIKR